MLDTTLDQLDPEMANWLYATILSLTAGGLGWFGLLLRTILQTKAAREALHSALATGVDFVTDEIAEALDLQLGRINKQSVDHLVSGMLDYVKGSVPQSIAKLGATDVQIEKMAKAYLNVRLQNMNPLTRIVNRPN